MLKLDVMILKYFVYTPTFLTIKPPRLDVNEKLNNFKIKLIIKNNKNSE